MKQYYVQRERANDYSVRVTTGGNSEIIATYRTERAARARLAEINYIIAMQQYTKLD
jgi:hypothetical protein